MNLYKLGKTVWRNIEGDWYYCDKHDENLQLQMLLDMGATKIDGGVDTIDPLNNEYQFSFPTSGINEPFYDLQTKLNEVIKAVNRHEFMFSKE